MAADRSLSAVRTIAELEHRQVDLANKILNGGLSYENYLIGVGRHRECRALIQMLSAKIEKASGQVDSEDSEDIEEEEDEAPEPQVQPGRRYKPRSWGS